MSFLVVLVVDDVDKVPELLHGWESIGVLGITIMESTGMGRIRRAGYRDDLPLMPSFRDLVESTETPHRTLFSVVDEETQVNRMIAVAEGVLGKLDEAHTGFLFVTPVLKAIGMGKYRIDRSNE